MSKNAFKKIKSGLDDAIAFAQEGTSLSAYHIHVPDDLDVREIRTSLKMSQHAFCAAFEIPLGTLRDWEQKRSRPDSVARTYLKVIQRKPRVVEDALHAS